MRAGTLASHIGIGLAAGLVGTLAMTIAQKVEMKITGREPSNTPAKGAEKVLGIEPESDEAESRLTTLVHFGYGTGWGVARGLLASAGLRGPVATALHYSAVQSAEWIMLPSLKLAPPPYKWGLKANATDMLHHLVYAAAAGWAFDAMHDAHRAHVRGEERGWGGKLVLGGLAAAALSRLGGKETHSRRLARTLHLDDLQRGVSQARKQVVDALR